MTLTAPHGFLRVAAACPPVAVADPEWNRRAILEFVARGGLVQARKKEAQQAKEEARRAKHAGTAAKMQAARMGGAYDQPQGRYTGGGLLVDAIVEGISVILSR